MFIKVNFIELFICYIYLVFFCSFVPHKPWLLHTSLYVILCDNRDDRLLIFYTCCISHALFSVKILIVQLNEVISPNLLLAKLSFNQWALCLWDFLLCCSVAELCPALRPRWLQHTRLLCPLLSLRVCSDSCPFRWWCCLTISSFASLFCLQSSQHRSFPVSQLLASSGQSVGCQSSNKGASKEYSGLIPLRLTDLIFQLGDSIVFSSTTIPKHQFCSTQPSLLFDILSRIVITFLPRSKCLNFMAAVILEKVKSVTASTFSPPISCAVMDAMVVF